MTTDLPSVPPAIIEFAKENNCDDVIVDKFWTENSYKSYDKVYIARLKGEKAYTKSILENNNEIRFASPDEEKELYNEKPYL